MATGIAAQPLPPLFRRHGRFALDQAALAAEVGLASRDTADQRMLTPDNMTAVGHLIERIVSVPLCGPQEGDPRRDSLGPQRGLRAATAAGLGTA
jgi:hypothetical protein